MLIKKTSLQHDSLKKVRNNTNATSSNGMLKHTIFIWPQWGYTSPLRQLYVPISGEPHKLVSADPSLVVLHQKLHHLIHSKVPYIIKLLKSPSMLIRTQVHICMVFQVMLIIHTEEQVHILGFCITCGDYSSI